MKGKEERRIRKIKNIKLSWYSSVTFKSQRSFSYLSFLKFEETLFWNNPLFVHLLVIILEFTPFQRNMFLLASDWRLRTWFPKRWNSVTNVICKIKNALSSLMMRRRSTALQKSGSKWLKFTEIFNVFCIFHCCKYFGALNIGTF